MSTCNKTGTRDITIFTVIQLAFHSLNISPMSDKKGNSNNAHLNLTSTKKVPRLHKITNL